MPAWETNGFPAAFNNPGGRNSDGTHGNGRAHRNSRPPVVYVLPPYRYFPNDSIYSYGVSSSTTIATPPPPNVVSMTPPPPEPVTTGFLTLDVEPRESVQVFVDGYFIGNLADLGNEIEVGLGARRIELRAPGYRTLVFDTEIVPDRTVVYRGSLERSATTSTPPVVNINPPSPKSRTIYVIPGCYVGNVPPVQANLRAGCDVKKMTKFEP